MYFIAFVKLPLRHEFPFAQTLRIMKLLTFLLIAFCLQVSANSYAQKITLSGKNLSLEKIFRLIEKQTDYVFFFDEDGLQRARTVTINIKRATLSEALTLCFNDQPLTYNIIGTTIVVSNHRQLSEVKKIEELLPPPIEIKGRITDADGNPLQGVSVIVKGTVTGVTTDADGNYSISVPDNGSKILVFSFVGMEKQEVKLSGNTTLSITMRRVLSEQQEVVLVGYGTQKQINLTGAVATANSKVFSSRPITNVGQALQGVIANLNITPNSGAPGRGANFNVRGITSINGGGPLVLVDGVVMDPNLINPQDIASVTVLKDAASSAIYGARAAYGVILISTKSGGTNKKPVISLSSNYSINQPLVVPHYMNSIEWTTWMNDARMNSSGRPYFDDETMGYVKAYFNDPVNNPSLVQHSADPPGVLREVGNTDWGKELLKDSYPMQQHTMSISGGGEKVSYFTSLGYFNQKGITKPVDLENFNRFNITQNISYKVNNWITAKAKIAYNGTRQTLNPSNSSNGFGGDQLHTSYSMWPIVPVLSPDGYYDETKGYNMVAYLKLGGYRKNQVNDLWMTGAVTLTPLKGLSVNLDYTYNSNNYIDMNFRRQYYTRDNGNILLAPWGNINGVKRNSSDYRYTALNAYASYEKSMHKHLFKALAGFNQEFGASNYFSGERRGLINNDIPYMALATGDQFASDGTNEYGIRGYFGRLNYSFDDKYLLELNGRYDGSSRFPSDNRFAFFPSVSAGWRISSEGFFSNLKKTINLLKIRGSYGKLGNQSVGDYYPYIASYGTTLPNYLFGGQQLVAVTVPGLVSPTLTWETVSQYNFGVDFALLRNRLSGNFDIYQRNTMDMLTKSKTLPAVLATAEPNTNAADLKTKGFEITLNWRDHIGNGINYGLMAVLSDYTGTITRYDNPKKLISDWYEGEKMGNIWGFVTTGLYQTDAEAQEFDRKALTSRTLTAGDLIFQDLNGDKKITPGAGTLDDHGDQTIIGNSTPRYSYGFRLDADWKGFDIAIFFQGVGKRQVWPSGMFFLNHYGDQWAVPQKFNVDYWTPENTDAFFPKARLSNVGDVRATQSYFLQNAAYLRLKQLTIGYSLPNRIIEKAGLSMVRIYFAGSNLWTKTKMLPVFDPEGTSTNMYPLLKSYSLGLNINF